MTKKFSLKKCYVDFTTVIFSKVYGFDIPNDQLDVLLYAKLRLY